MTRKLPLALALSSILFSTNANALGLSNIDVTSHLNEPFKAKINVLSIPKLDNNKDSLVATLASAEAFRRAGIERPYVLNELRFEIEPTDATQAVIHIRTNQPVKEPFLNFLVEVKWPSGRILREYTALLDPPLYEPKIASAQPPATVGAMSANKTTLLRPTGKASNSSSSSKRGTVTGGEYRTTSGDTLSSIASRTLPSNTSLRQHMNSIYDANPDAFIAGNMNRLKAGQVLRVPDFDGTLKPAEVNRAVASAASTSRPAATQKKPEKAPESALKAAAAQTGPKLTDEPSVRIAGLEQGNNAQAGNPSKSAELETLRTSLARVEEENLRLSNENKTLKEDLQKNNDLIVTMKKQLDELNTLIKLQNEQLATLQTQLSQPVKPVDSAAATTSAGTLPTVKTTTTATTTVEPTNTTATTSPTEVNPTTPTSNLPVETTVNKPTVATPVDSSTLQAGTQPTGTLPTETTVTAKPTETTTIVPNDTTATTATPDNTATTTPTTEPVTNTPTAEAGADANKTAETTSTAETATTPSTATDEAVEPTGILDIVEETIPGGLMTLGGIGGGLLLLGGGAFLLSRRRKAKEQEEEDIRQELERLKAEEQDNTDDTETLTTAKAADDAVEEDISALMQQISNEDSTSGVLNDELFEEVDVYIAYERYDQAEDLLRNALAEDPTQQEYRMKLLEVLTAAKKVDAFETEARILHDATGGKGVLWERTQALWQDLDTNRELFADSPASTSKAGVAAAAIGGAALGAGLMATSGNDDDLDFDLDMGADDTASLDTGSDDLDLDMGNDDLSLDMGADDTASLDMGNDDLSLDMSGDELNSLSLDDDTQLSLGNDDLEMDAGNFSLDNDLGLDSTDLNSDLGDLDLESDDIGDKFNLAQMYRDMEDNDTARNILSEILAEGNAEQKQKAQTMMEEIS
ncbi:FimV N-terminal domain protein [Beggiatoa alba B18LD]|uniref:FimV N-terminal domain protein n=1 Tax=Beggiatoa alba B18LD TaxID=395493 RepID=I3CL49_9GAMM|nr:FimV/HubP family polar landmark protein [Beggiatoa alba]EIJ44342.1 FimV N-terminal domain protein [Beggiatoa alba B18LD]